MKCAPGGSFDLSVFSFGADDCRLRLVYYDIRLTSTKCEKMGGLATAHPAWKYEIKHSTHALKISSLVCHIRYIFKNEKI